MKKFYLNLFFASSLLIGSRASAQMSGSYSIPGSFPTLAAAISSLNAVGINGAVTIDIAAGYTETAPSGGYVLTATGTGGDPIIFQKSGSGANPLLSAYSGGTSTPSSSTQDGIFLLVGSDFVTINNIDLFDPNTTNPATMEFGYGLYKASATDGCQYNTILGCTITLSKINNATGSMPALHGSRGIDIINALPTANTTSLTVTSANGSNSYNGFYANTITDCNYGISLVGFTDVSPFSYSDTGNNFSGNSILNFGGATGAVNQAGGIVTYAQQNVGINGNTLDNNNGSGIDHPAALVGIHMDVAESSTNSASGNTIALHGGGTTHQLSAIECSAAANISADYITIGGNIITGCTYATATSGSFYGILNSASSSSLIANGNNFTNNSTGASSGGYYNLYNSGNISSDISLNGNSINGIDLTASTVSTTLCNIYCSGTSSLANLGISGNNFQNINFLGTTGGTGMYSGIYVTANVASISMNGNSFINLSLNTSGPIHFIHNNGTTPIVNAFGNSINTGFARTSTSGDTYFYYGNSTATSGLTDISYNNVSNISQSGTSAFYGIYNQVGTSQQQQCAGNTFSVISNGSGLTSIISMTAGSTSKCINNTLSNITASGTIYGINCNAGITTNDIYQNSISSFTGAGASTVYPLYVADGSQADIYRNRIYDIVSSHAGGSAFGIYIAENTAPLSAQHDTIYNNLIADIHAPIANAALPVVGIYVAGGSNVHVFYNTVNISTSSSAIMFGSSALFASTVPLLELKNNILVNTSIASGAGVTSAFGRNGTNLTTYMTTSDHNLFYAGGVNTNQAIFYDGTTAYSYLSAFKTLVTGRDLTSVTENPSFISNQGPNINFLELNSVIPTQAESGAWPITQIQTDYNGNVRNLTTPDIGAHENTYVAAGDLSSPTLLSPTLLSNDCNTSTRTLSLNLMDASGVATGAAAPKVYYKVNSGVYTSVQGALAVGTVSNGTWTFVLNYTAAGSDVISYYLVAQDVVTIPNLLASPANGFSGVNVNSITTPPTILYTFTVLPAPLITIANTTVCAGTSASLTAVGAGVSTYTWSGPSSYSSALQTAIISSASSTSAGTYSLMATGVNGCSTTVSATLMVNALPVISVSNSVELCTGESASISASGASSYSWMPGSILTPTANITPTATTVYSVTGVNASGCSSTASVNVSVKLCTGINSYATENKISLFPNPTSGILNVTFNAEGSKEILILNAAGDLVQRLQTNDMKGQLNLASLAKGMYFIKVIGAGYSTTSKIVLE